MEEFGHEFLESCGGFPFDVSEDVAGDVVADAFHFVQGFCSDEAGEGDFDVFSCGDAFCFFDFVGIAVDHDSCLVCLCCVVGVEVPSIRKFKVDVVEGVVSSAGEPELILEGEFFSWLLEFFCCVGSSE